MPLALIIYPSRLKLLRGVIAGVLLAIFCYAVVHFHARWHVDALWYGLAFSGIPVALCVSLFWLIRALMRQPLLTVTQAGITDSSSLVGAGLIRWDEIARITQIDTQMPGGTLRYFTIIPRDRQAIIARQRMPLTKLNTWAADGTITISQVMAPMAVSTLLHQVEEYYQANIAPHTTERVTFTATG